MTDDVATRLSRRNVSSIRAFTLIELLIVASILAVVVGSIGTCLAAGIRVWETARRFNRLEGGAVIGMAIMEKDMVNLITSRVLPFAGGEKEISIPSILESLDASGRHSEGIGIVKYSFRPDKGLVIRKQWAYSGDEPPHEAAETIIRNVSDFSLSYYHHAPLAAGAAGSEGSVGGWRTEWAGTTNLPAAIRVRILRTDGEDRTSMEKTVLMPLAKREGQNDG